MKFAAAFDVDGRGRVGAAGCNARPGNVQPKAPAKGRISAKVRRQFLPTRH